jgi:hypothetical protein
VRERGREVATETVESLRSSTHDFLAAHTQVKEAEINVVHGRLGKYQEKVDTQTAIQTELQQQLTVADESANILLSDQLKAQLQQQNQSLISSKTN